MPGAPAMVTSVGDAIKRSVSAGDFWISATEGVGDINNKITVVMM